MNAHADLPAVGQTIEVEQALLGAILINNDALQNVSDFLEAKHFGEPIHRELYALIEQQIAAGKTVTPVTVKTLRQNDFQITPEVTWSQYLARMAAEALTIINARDHGSLVLDGYRARCVAEHCEAAITDMRSDWSMTRIDEMIDGLADKLADVRALALQQPMAGESWLDRMDPDKPETKAVGVPIWSRAIRTVLSEDLFECGNLYGLLSSSGEGKTSLVLQIIFHALTVGHPVLFLSYDQSRDQCVSQICAQELSIEGSRQKTKRVSRDEFQQCRAMNDELVKRGFRVIRCTDEKVSRLATYARGFRRSVEKQFALPPLIVIDHIGAITKDDPRADAGTQAQSVNRPLKSLAGELDCPILLLNQRNGKGDGRPNPTPIAADLYGGQKAREDYDCVFFLYRYMKWFKERKESAGSQADWNAIERAFPESVREHGHDDALIGAIKVRFGDPSIREKMRFEPRFTRYRDFQTTDQEPLL